MGRLSFVPLEAFHVNDFPKQRRQQVFKGHLDETSVARLVAGFGAKAGLLDGVPVVLGGIVDRGEGRGEAWSLISEGLPYTAWPEVIAEMRHAVEAALDPTTGWAHRVHAETMYDWPEGHKLLLHLGMSFEGMTRGGMPGGLHGVTYARVRGDVPALPLRCSALMGVVERCLWEDSMGHAVPWAVDEARREARGWSGGRQGLQRSEAPEARTVPPAHDGASGEPRGLSALDTAPAARQGLPEGRP